LPNGFQALPGQTCYFLNGFKHSNVDAENDTQAHIDAAIKQIHAEANK
jgi:hypothetical protein